jgi:hypothetical protein
LFQVRPQLLVEAHFMTAICQIITNICIVSELMSVVFSYSNWDFLGTWHDERVFYFILDILGIML